MIYYLLMKPTIDDIETAIERMHNCKAYYLEEVAVREKFGDKTVWERVAYLFESEGHSKAKQCFFRASPDDDSKEYGYYAVLSVPSIDSPQKAVRASLVRDPRTGKLK